MKKQIIYLLLIMGITVNIASAQQNVTISVNIEGLVNETGHVGVQLMNETNKTVASAYINTKQGYSAIAFGMLTPGKYAVRFYHDENGNQKMDTNLMGIPTEGYGFSNNRTGIMGTPPPFKDMLFDAYKDIAINIKALYK